MANLYGVATPNPLPAGAGTIGGVDVIVPGNVETNVIGIALPPAVSAGFYYPWVAPAIDILLGPTPPTQVTVGYRLGAGSDFASNGPPLAAMVGNATIYFSAYLAGASAIVSNPYTTITLFVTLYSFGQQITCKAGSQAYGGWLRAPDQ